MRATGVTSNHYIFIVITFDYMIEVTALFGGQLHQVLAFIKLFFELGSMLLGRFIYFTDHQGQILFLCISRHLLNLAVQYILIPLIEKDLRLNWNRLPY